MTLPLQGQSPTPGLDPQNPYPGLQPFDERDQSYFYGRSEERDELARMVHREVLTVLFGLSGLGKTSMLNAALFPLLREEQYLPVRIRLDFSPEAGPLTAQVRATVLEAARAKRVEATEPREDETLWEYFHRAELWNHRNRLQTPLLVFDQFEEIFTIGRFDARVQPFLAELVDLVENRIPASVRQTLEESEEDLPFSYERQKLRVILSLREDYLPQLEDLRPLMPSLAFNRFRLKRMNGVQAKQAVLGPGGDLVSPKVADQILQFIAGGREEEGAPSGGSEGHLNKMVVEPALLSLFCRELNDKRRARGLAEISGKLVAGERSTILSGFYERSLADLSPAIREFIEDRLLTGSGFRRSEALEDALEVPGVTADALTLLVNRRLLRVERRLGVSNIELIHDVLTSVIQESRDRRRRLESRRRIQKRVIAGAAALFALVIATALFAWHESQNYAEAEKLRGLAEAALLESNKDKKTAEEALLESDEANKTAASARQGLVDALVQIQGEKRKAENQRGLAERMQAVAETEAARAENERAGAEAERLRAEEVITFVLFDLRDELSRISRIDLREKTQQKALDYYLALPEEKDSPSSARSRGVAFSNLGDVFMEQGRTAEAQQVYEQALVISERLARMPGEDALLPRDLLQLDLSVSHQSLAGALTQQGKTEDALRHHQVALSLAEDTEDEEGQLVQHLEVGSLLLDMGKSEEGLRHLRQAFEVAEARASSESEDLTSRGRLGDAHASLGAAQRVYGSVEQSLEHHQAALLIAEELGTDPSDIAAKENLASVHLNLANTLISQGNAAAAEENLQKANAILPFDSRDLSSSTYLIFLDMLNSSACARLEMGRPDESLSLGENAVEIGSERSERDPENSMLRLSLASSYLTIGEAKAAQEKASEALENYAEALGIISELDQKQPKTMRLERVSSWAYFLRGEALSQLNRQAEAKESWNLAYQTLSPWMERVEDADMLDTYARVLLRLGELPKARDICGKLQARGWNYRNLINLCFEEQEF